MCLRGGPICFPMFSMDLCIVWTSSILSTAPDAVLFQKNPTTPTFDDLLSQRSLAHKLATYYVARSVSSSRSIVPDHFAKSSTHTGWNCVFAGREGNSKQLPATSLHSWPGSSKKFSWTPSATYGLQNLQTLRCRQKGLESQVGDVFMSCLMVGWCFIVIELTDWNPGIVGAESILCDTIHWDSMTFLRWQGFKVSKCGPMLVPKTKNIPSQETNKIAPENPCLEFFPSF